MWGQFVGEVVPVALDADEVHGERKLFIVQAAIFVDV